MSTCLLQLCLPQMLLSHCWHSYLIRRPRDSWATVFTCCSFSLRCFSLPVIGYRFQPGLDFDQLGLHSYKNLRFSPLCAHTFCHSAQAGPLGKFIWEIALGHTFLCILDAWPGLPSSLWGRAGLLSAFPLLYSPFTWSHPQEISLLLWQTRASSSVYNSSHLKL